MMTKFDQELYARIKAKKNEPFSSISQWRVRVVEKEKEVTEKGLSTPVSEEGQAASPSASIKEITLRSKKCWIGDKEKEKDGANVSADSGTTLVQANEVVTPEEMKEISGVPSHEM